MKCLVIDDEELARELVKSYISQIQDLEIVATCRNVLEAQKIMETTKIDLLFLDIEMPQITGIEFLKMLKTKPLCILTTAYTNYALEGYQMDIVDYLVKPFAFDRFYQAFVKAKEYWQLLEDKKSPSKKIAEVEKEYFFVKSGYKIIKIVFKNILFVKGLREYVQIFLKEDKIITLTSLSKLMDILPQNQFARVHKSYIINLEKIESIEGNVIEIENNSINIGKSYRKDFLENLNQFGLL